MNFVYKTNPRHTEEKVPTDQPIEIYFMVDVNKAALKDEHFILLNLTEQAIEPVRFEYNMRLLKVTPLSKLKPNNHYQLQVVGGTDGIKDIIGRMMADTYELEFYTKDVASVKAPRILAPTDLSVITTYAAFELEPAEGADYYELQISKSNTFHNLVWPIDGEKVYQTSVTPNIAYETGQYYMRVRTIATDGTVSSWSPVIRYYYNGEPAIELPVDDEVPEETVSAQSKKVVLQTNTQIQQTAKTELQSLQNIFSVQAEAGTGSLYVTSTTPKDGSVHNPLANSKRIVITFSEDVDPDSVTSDNCYVLVERN